MEALSDDDYERISDIDISDCESDQDRSDHETPSSTPPSLRAVRPSDRKNIACTYPDCPKTFNRKARLEEHLRSHTNDRIFKCNFGGCGKDFLRETHLKHHIKSAHSDIRDHKCTWEGCDKSFATGTRLRRHFLAHEGREKYRCRGYENCNQTFRKHETLKRHILQVHEQMRPFPCTNKGASNGEVCHKAFDTAEKLRAHERSKHDEARFTCTECFHMGYGASPDDPPIMIYDVCFDTFSDLQAHIAQDHPPTCPYCPTSFKTARELTRHLELQHNVRDPNLPKSKVFECSFPDCDRTFTKKGNLNVHIKTVHENKKDFVCGETEIVLALDTCPQGPVEVYGCGRTFTTKASLEDHVRSAHLGVTSLQVERKKKRKAERREAEDQDMQPKTRKPRKDKGLKKTSILESLTGAPVAFSNNGYMPIDPALDASSEAYVRGLHPESHVSPEYCIKIEPDAEPESEEDDEWNQLSGSMTMLDGQLYHNGEQYQFSAGQYAPGMTPPLTEQNHPSNPVFDQGYCKIESRYTSIDHEEPFFDGFEHEPEPLGSTQPRSVSMIKSGF